MAAEYRSPEALRALGDRLEGAGFTDGICVLDKHTGEVVEHLSPRLHTDDCHWAYFGDDYNQRAMRGWCALGCAWCNALHLVNNTNRDPRLVAFILHKNDL
jgi:hypothetical protein